MRIVSFLIFIAGLILGGVGGYLVNVYAPIPKFTAGEEIVPHQNFVKEWRGMVVGDIVDITPESIIVLSGGKTLRMQVKEGTNIQKSVVKKGGGEPTITKDLTLESIRGGDKVSVAVVLGKDGALGVEAVYALFVEE